MPGSSPASSGARRPEAGEAAVGAGAPPVELPAPLEPTSGSERLELDAATRLRPEAGEVWLVESGRIEVFVAREEAGGEGPRTHLGSVAPGEVLFGAEPEAVPGGGRRGLLCLGAQDTRVRRVPAADIVALAAWSESAAGDRPAAGAGAAARAARWLDGWLSLLWREVPREPAPKVYVELRPGATVELTEAGNVALPLDEVCWVRHLAGETRLLGQGELAAGGAGLLPVVPGTWLVGAGGARLACASTAELAADPALLGEALAGGLAGAHRLLLLHLEAEAGRWQERERERLARKAELDRATLAAAYGRLASVFVPQSRAAGAPALDEDTEPLLAACRVVGEAQGFTVRPPARATGGRRVGDLLPRICDASRVRFRRIILRGDWWRRDNGPLLAFLAAEGGQSGGGGRAPDRSRPVALLPTSPRSYELVDPMGGRRVPVDAATALTVTGEGYMFYPPLPERQLDHWDLLRAAFGDRRRDLATIALMGLAGGLLALLVPLATGQLFGSVIPGADRSQLVELTLALLVSAGAGAAFQITRSLAVLRLGGKMDGTLQAAVWERLLSLPVAFFRRFTVGDLANRSLGLDTMRELLAGNVVTALLGGVFSLTSFALLFYYSGRLALLATGLAALLMAVTVTLVFLQLRHQRRLVAQEGKISSLLLGLINGIAKLRIGGAEPRAFSLWAARFADQRRQSLQAQRLANLQTTFNAVYSGLTTLAVFAVAGLSAQSSLPVGDFLAFNSAFGQFLTAALSLVAVLSGVLALVPLYERITPILATVPEVDATKIEPGELAGEVEFSHVSFRYQEGGPLVLDDVSFLARPGEFIALVGPSGSGKSTCLRLVLGFESASSGSIYFDGQDLSSLAVRSVRRQIGVVLQTGRPMVGDLYSNIVGGANLSLEDAWEAARMAGLDEDIKAMPMGMHTVVGEGAETFSGGQKQRLLIARAVVQRPRILLFDEATSALDNRTQEVVSRSLARLQATRIVIAHRLSTIQGADRIYVIDGGRVVESGRFQELAARGGLFTRLVERQIV